MRKALKLVSILIPLFLCFVVIIPHLVTAQSSERIDSFDVLLRIKEDNTVFVTENILYDFGGMPKHGIYRKIPKTYKAPSGNGNKKYKLFLKDFTVTTSASSITTPVDISREDERNKYGFRIGDPHKTVTGKHLYTLRYTIENVVDFYEDFDELYWNATGNEWDVPIEEASLSIVLPNQVSVSDLTPACFEGKRGSRKECGDSAIIENGIGVKFISTNLSPHEGLTGALGFPKGIVSEIEKIEAGVSTTVLFGLFSLLGVFWTFLLGYAYRNYVKVREPKGRSVIVRQYDPPKNLSPMEIGYLMDKRVDNRDVTAEIVYLAEQGYIHIVSIPQKILFFKKGTDYYLFKMKKEEETMKKHQKMILNSIFMTGHSLTMGEKKNLIEKVTLSNSIKGDKARLIGRLRGALSVSALKDLKKDFYVDLEMIRVALKQELVDTEYIVLNDNQNKSIYLIVLIVIIPVGVLVMNFFNSALSVIASLGSFAAAFLGFLMFPNHSRTQNGVDAKEHSLGLKQYLSIAEKDRLEFHFNPKHNPELFEKLLPFAIALAVDKQWARELGDLYINPDWYTDTGNTNFTIGALYGSFSGFGTAAGASYAPPSSSGSGGGGFSGGGGGGGGGGSW